MSSQDLAGPGALLRALAQKGYHLQLHSMHLHFITSRNSSKSKAPLLSRSSASKISCEEYSRGCWIALARVASQQETFYIHDVLIITRASASLTPPLILLSAERNSCRSTLPVKSGGGRAGVGQRRWSGGQVGAVEEADQGRQEGLKGSGAGCAYVSGTAVD